MPTRLASGGWSLVLLSACAALGCSRHQPDDNPQPSASASAGASNATAAPREEPKRPTPPPPAPVTPAVPPQLVACGTGRDFYRLTDKALEVFEVSKTIPPPQIRGSAAAVQVATFEVAQALNVVPLKKGVLVIGRQGLFRYAPGHEQLRDSGFIPTPAPLVAWSADRAESFWVRALGEASLREYTLARAPKAAPAARAQALPGFDARLFTVLGDGVPLYSTAAGLVRAGDEAAPASAPKLPEPAKLIFPDVSRDRYWAADALGNLGLWDHKRGSAGPGRAAPVFSARVPGAVIDVALEGGRIAVLSIEARDQAYRPTVTIFAEAKEQAQRRVSWTPAASGQPQVDLCLIPGRPWVVVGGKRWLQLVDWQTPRLLAEW